MKIHISTLFEKSGRHKSLIHNFSYLSALQIFNLLVPFITYPYLIRVLGKDIYGLVVYAQVVISYLQIIVNYGYNTSALKEVSIHRENKQKLSEIVSSVIISKGLLFLLSLIILWAVVVCLPEASTNKLLFLFCMWVCLYDMIFPVWFFQGIEKMKYITYLTLTSRSVFILLTFVFIKSPEHYLRVPLINGAGAIIAGSIALYIIHVKEKISFSVPSFRSVYIYFKKSTDYFISDVSVKIFASSNKFIIGTFLGLTELAYYDLADKIVSLFRGIPLDIVRNTIYPRVAKTKNILLVKKTTILMSIYAILAIIVINTFAPSIISVLGGKEMLPSLNIVRLFSIIIFTTHVSNYYITVGLWSFDYVRVFRNMMIISAVMYLAIYGIFSLLKIINIYTITLTPILVDIYLIVHIFFIWKELKLKLNDTKS